MKRLMTILMLTACTPQIYSGADGSQGLPGADGLNSLIEIVNSAPVCLQGGIIVLSGLDANNDNILGLDEVSHSQPICNGLNGFNGTNGINGHNALVTIMDSDNGGGSSCFNDGLTLFTGTDLNDNGNLEVDEVSHSKDVCSGINGVDGVDGEDGQDGINADPSPFSITSKIDPCGQQSSYDEIFLLLGDGTLIASVSKNVSGNMTRLSNITPPPNSVQNWTTTDETGCGVTLSRDGSNNISLTTSNGVGGWSWSL